MVGKNKRTSEYTIIGGRIMGKDIKTVLGNVDENDILCCLSHEHICCYSDYIYKMSGSKYLDKEKLIEKSVIELKRLKNTCGMNLFIDCTPVNIGRDVELMKTVSEKSGVNIVCSTGFYYTDEPVLYNASEETLADYIVDDANKTNAGIIKCAVENENLTPFNEKLIKAIAIAHKRTRLPIALHTNAHNKNGLKALKIMFDYGVQPQCITVSHLSDTENIEYITEIANYGCFVALDRMYNDTSKEYIAKKLKTILALCKQGFENKILFNL